MGDLLARPEKQKFSTVFETTHLRVGCCSMQGWRKTMEDAHVAQLSLNGKKTRAFFGVFDGHQSDEAAHYCRAHMLDELIKAINDTNGEYKQAFENAFHSIDEQICRRFSSSGTTANCVLLMDKKIICANAGDSRAVLFRDGKAIPLSTDHKPTLEEEEARIRRAGAQVENGRVNMTLAISRALGDVDFKTNKAFSWKEQAVTALPDVTQYEVQGNDELIILGCDGIWDVLSSQDCCMQVHELLHKNEVRDSNCVDISLVCEQILDNCIAQSNTAREGTDNMTIIIVEFKKPFLFQ
ncbi:unnamed protein product [Phytomonas sp. EM1]|nr:unnamed protein product [Phytomonas sp. EM1]|eukprot:CCW59938.1 unnamed protein product [Phytomonas sp. isolate EM1]